MNIAQISNLFNQVCQGITAANTGRIGFYHYGWYSDINAEIQNNWNTNTVGSKFPKVLLLYPTSSISIKEKGGNALYNCRMIFADLQHYDNDGAYDGRSVLELHRDLEALAVNVLAEFNRLGRLQGIGLTTPANFTYLSDAHNNRLSLIEATFSITTTYDCPTDEADIPALPAPFNDVPVGSNDLELL